MSSWKKTSVSQKEIEPLCKTFGLSQLLAAIFVRRGITEGKELLYFLEGDSRFLHQSFCFGEMEDVVERILQAKDEGEKVLIFGDKDVDGITSTAILYSQLLRMGLDVQYRLPMGDDAYGLSIAAVDDFAKDGGTLIITVDCGISNVEEIKYANSLGMEVIVTDHHNPPEVLPDAILFLNPKLKESGYPFSDISGAAVAYKLANALRFSQTSFYNAEICILNIEEDSKNQKFVTECVKIKNLVPVKKLKEEIIPGKTSIYDLKLLNFLSNQVIYAWDSAQTKKILSAIFGSGIDFSIMDLRSEVAKLIPSVKNKSAEQIASLSLLAKYDDEEKGILNGLANLYVTYCNIFINEKYKDFQKNEAEDIQLAGIAALADIMPMKNENRILVKNAVSSIKKFKTNMGLAQLLSRFSLNPQEISCTDLSWTVIPALNATGRMGKPEIALKLLLSEDAEEQRALSQEIFELNEERKKQVAYSAKKIQQSAVQSIQENDGKLCLIIDDELNKGLTGLIASKIMQDYSVPAMVVTKNGEYYIGSLRSFGSFISTDFLEQMGDIFVNFGGHDYAAGFSFESENFETFKNAVKNTVKKFEKAGEIEELLLDAQIPPDFLTPELFSLIEKFEPYGNENKELTLCSTELYLSDAKIFGKKEPFHLRLEFDTGKFKIPAILWSGGSRLNEDIQVGKKYDIVYNLDVNTYRGNVSRQLKIKECILHES